MLALLTLVVLSTPLTPPQRLVHRSAQRFTTAVKLTVPIRSVSDATLDAAFDAVLTEFDRLDGVLSEWRPDTPISRLNAAGGAWVVLPQEAFDVVAKAVELAALTEGAFDPTFKTLSPLWPLKSAGFVPPTPTAVAALLPAVGYKKIELDPKRMAARLADPSTRVGLGGVAKGYALERAVALLRARGLVSFCLRVGGELYCAGDKGGAGDRLRQGEKAGKAWIVGVQDPRDPKGLVATLPLRDAAFTTSGDYERAALYEGVRYHHILDTRTGYPARGIRSVTILARSPTEADALSTGVFVLGLKAGLALVESLPAAEVVIVDDAGHIHTSRGLRGALEIIK